MKNNYKQIIILNAEAIAEALARGFDVQITTCKNSDLKIKILDIKILKAEKSKGAY